MCKTNLIGGGLKAKEKHTHMHACTHACMHTHIHTHMLAHTHIIHIHTRTHTHTHRTLMHTHTHFYPSPYHSLSSRCEDGSEGFQDNPDWCWSGRSWCGSQPHQLHVPEFPADCAPAAGPGAGNPEARLGERQLRSHGCGPEQRQEHCRRLLDQGRRGLVFSWCWVLDHWWCELSPGQVQERCVGRGWTLTWTGTITGKRAEVNSHCDRYIWVQERGRVRSHLDSFSSRKGLKVSYFKQKLHHQQRKILKYLSHSLCDIFDFIAGSWCAVRIRCDNLLQVVVVVFFCVFLCLCVKTPGISQLCVTRSLLLKCNHRYALTEKWTPFQEVPMIRWLLVHPWCSFSHVKDAGFGGTCWLQGSQTVWVVCCLCFSMPTEC